LVAGVALPESLPDGSTGPLLDAAVHVGALADVNDSRLYVPASLERVWFSDAVSEPRGSVSVTRTVREGDDVTVDITIAARSGVPCLSMRSLRYRALDFGNGQPGEPHGLGESGSDARKFVYTIDWQPRPEYAQSRPVAGPRRVAVEGDDAAASLLTRLEDGGCATAALSDARYVLYVADSQPATATESDVDFAVRISAEVTDLVRTLAQRDIDNPVALWIVTRGVHEATSPSALRQSFVWGLAGVIAAEHPELWGGLVDLAVDADLGEAAPALADLLATPSKSILVLRDGLVLAPALAPVRGERVRKSLRCRPDAAYLITGGMGALGLLMASWLADRGARRLVLTGRTPLPPRRDWHLDTIDAGLRRKIDAIRTLEMRGVAVEAVAIDIGCRDDVQALLAKRDRVGAAPIHGIIHAAGVTNDQLVTNMSGEAARQVMWPKISGSQALHEAFPTGSVDFLFLIASAAAIFGIPGQGSYAAANSYLDALARMRRQQGCHTLSLDWVAWRGLGFASDAQLVSQELQRMGSRDITPAEAFTAWEYADTYDIAQAVVVPVPTAVGADGSAGTDTRLVPARNWSRMPATEVRGELEDGLRRIIAAELRVPEAELDIDRPFAELGLNSLMAMAIRHEAEQFVGIELSVTMLFNHPTVASLSGYLARLVAPSTDSEEDEMALLSASAGSILDSLLDEIESSSPQGDRSA
jgi:phthiocerol/phenolphthiocerol synthesis type-I polyketide synthase A